MLIIKDVEFSYGSQVIFRNLNLKVEEGEFIYIIGQSGSGKSTLFEMILMNVLPDSGYVQFGDFSSESISTKKLPLLRRKIGIVFQDYKLLNDRTVYDNLLFVVNATGKKTKNKKKLIFDTLAEVGLTDKAKSLPSELSGGEKQRVSIARAIINEPQLILADEPTGNLDPETTAEIMQIFTKIHKRGASVIFATHNYDIVKKYRADKIYKIENGSIKKVVLKKKES